MVHELVHETVNIKGWDVVGSVDWKIGKETELPFEEHNPNKDFHDMSHDKLRNVSWVKQQQ